MTHSSIPSHSSRDGFVLTQVRSGTSGWEADGIYHVTAQRRTRLAEGWVQNPAIAPGGCRLAFTLKPGEAAARAAAPPRPSLVVVDLCATGGTRGAALTAGRDADDLAPDADEVTLTTAGSM